MEVRIRLNNLKADLLKIKKETLLNNLLPTRTILFIAYQIKDSLIGSIKEWLKTENHNIDELCQILNNLETMDINKVLDQFTSEEKKLYSHLFKK